eukprot:CAMPEP_0197446194 /NCGR_PEP_ID=MMETSP1175-20131217/11202_1 /TAXON_ID=1003142 /ORGANISM="Triceratium dubium, Strain CCMP147" /LENGTH=131 /DNA_ID=CAMNT_0042977271 /DNA_START=63 /DNA_END=458 /DNA_ORIENTATION=+
MTFSSCSSFFVAALLVVVMSIGAAEGSSMSLLVTGGSGAGGSISMLPIKSKSQPSTTPSPAFISENTITVNQRRRRGGIDDIRNVQMSGNAARKGRGNRNSDVAARGKGREDPTAQQIQSKHCKYGLFLAV